MFFNNVKSLAVRLVMILTLLSGMLDVIPVEAEDQQSASSLISPGDTTRVSVSSSGEQADGGSYATSISKDGRFISFNSSATNLVPGDTNGMDDIFVHNVETGMLTLVSVNSDGFQGNSSSSYSSISGDGRFVAYHSSATNLVSGDTNGVLDIFVHDMQTGSTTRVSVDSMGGQANGTSFVPSISADGRFIAFVSSATNLVKSDTNGADDIFVYDRLTGVTTRVSVTSSGMQADDQSYAPSISADGRYIAYYSWATNLVPNDTNGMTDVFIRDVQTNITASVSIDSSGALGNGNSVYPSISEDGRYIAFGSGATNLVSGDDNGMSDIFLHDTQTLITKRVSVDSASLQGNNHSFRPSISGDGNFVAYHSDATNLVPDDTNGAPDIFLYSVQNGVTDRVSVDSLGVQGNDFSNGVAVSGDGQIVSFFSAATNLVNGDTNQQWDIFLHRPVISTPPQPSIHYVKWDASGVNNGTSWADAFTDLQAALAAASSSDEIWIAAGTYKPTTGTDRTVSFVLKNGVALYGGFAGTETSLTQRDPDANPTVLSGDIGNGNDTSDNSYHVVVGSNTDNSAILDGFTVTGGNANLSQLDTGGGMLNYRGSPSVRNVIFSANSAGLGGGMYNGGEYSYTYGSSPILTNVVFSGNSAVEGGGMRNENYSSPVLTHVTFINNTAVRSGGGMENFHYGNPTLSHVTFSENSASAGGAMMNWDHSSPVITNVTIHANTVTYEGGGIYNDNGSNPILTNVTLSHNVAAQGGGLYNAYGSNASIRNSIFYGNTGGEIFDVSGTRLVTYSIVEGGYAGTGNIDIDPLLGPLQDNGGFTHTMALGQASPAIDAGDDVSCPATDQRGVARPQGIHCDIGAFEYESLALPTPTNTPSSTPTFTPSSTPSPAFTPTPAVFTLVFQPDTAAGLDTYIYSGSRNSNFGTLAEMGIGEDNNSKNRVARSLIKFDLSSIPANATIHSAALSLWTASDLSSNDRTIQVYRLRVPFEETQASWNQSAAGVSWQIAGASGLNDRESVAIGSATIPNNEAINIEKQIVLNHEKVQEWLDGSFANNGFIVVADVEENDRFNYKTSDSTASSQRPKLVIQYSLSSVTPAHTPTQTPSATGTATIPPSATSTASLTPTSIGSGTVTPTLTPANTPISTPLSTITPTPSASTLVLQPDASQGIDTYLYSGSRNSNFGTSAEMGIGEDNNSKNRTARSLIKFDLSSIPSNAFISSVTLSVWTSSDRSSSDRMIRVYRLLVPFDETQASWNQPSAGVSWQSAGASGPSDRETAPVGSVNILNNEPLNFEKQILLSPAGIQEMVDGSFVNHGFIIVADVEENDRFNYKTSDSPAASQRPMLVIQYTIPSVTPTNTSTYTPSPTVTLISTATATHTATQTPTLISTATPVATLTASPTNTLTRTPTATARQKSTATASATSTPPATHTATRTPTSSPPPSPTVTSTSTSTASVTPTSTSVPTSAPTSTPPTATGLLGHWKFDESSWAGDCSTADMLDSSGNNRHGIACIDGDAPFPVPGKFGNAGRFDGIYQYANMGPGFNFTSSFTAAMWIALDDYDWCGPTGKSQHIIGTHHLETPTGNGRGWGIYWDCDGLAWELTNSTGSAIGSYGYVQPSPFPVNGSWHHIALVYDSSVPSATLYWDGVAVYSETGTANVPSFLFNNGEPLTVNGLPYAPSAGAPGMIDETRVYNRALSVDEITSLYEGID